MTNYRRRRTKPKDTSRRFRTNDQIASSEVRLIDDGGNFLGIMRRSEAIQLADDQEKDLVEINPKAEPPVVKLIEFSKFKYQQDKSEKKNKKSTDTTKTLRVSVRISSHDLLVQAKKADEFLKKNLKVKLQVQMKGREKSHPEVAEETMHNFLSMITENYDLETTAKLIGDSCFASIKAKKEKNNSEPKLNEE